MNRHSFLYLLRCCNRQKQRLLSYFKENGTDTIEETGHDLHLSYCTLFLTSRTRKQYRVVSSFPLLGQSDSGSDFSKLFKNANYTTTKNRNQMFLGITIRRVRIFNTYKKPTTDTYTLKRTFFTLKQFSYRNILELRKIYLLLFL